MKDLFGEYGLFMIAILCGMFGLVMFIITFSSPSPLYQLVDMVFGGMV